MGFIWKQQGSLKLSSEQGLVDRGSLAVGEEYQFQKDGYRLYMLETPMELITDDWKAIARIIVMEIIVGKNLTKGKFKVLKIYTDEEVEVVSGTLIPFDKVKNKNGHTKLISRI